MVENVYLLCRATEHATDVIVQLVIQGTIVGPSVVSLNRVQRIPLQNNILKMLALIGLIKDVFLFKKFNLKNIFCASVQSYKIASFCTMLFFKINCIENMEISRPLYAIMCASCENLKKQRQQ